MKRACGLLLAVVLLAGCGDDKPNFDEKRMNTRFDTLDYQMSDIEISQPPYVENLERLTGRYIALIHEYEDELGSDEIKNRLAEKAAELEDYCLSCATTLEREREKY